MFRSRNQALDWVPRDGDRVEARALPGLYMPRGEFQLQVERCGAPAPARSTRRSCGSRRRSRRAGLFDAARKRPLPAHPRTIGVVTSPQARGAARRPDRRSARRAPHVEVIVFPAPVQGEARRRGIATRSLRRRMRGAAPDRRAAAGARRRQHRGPVGVQRRARSRARSPRRRCRSSAASGTRPTSRSPTSSPTCARRRRRPRPSSRAPTRSPGRRAGRRSARLRCVAASSDRSTRGRSASTTRRGDCARPSSGSSPPARASTRRSDGSARRRRGRSTTGRAARATRVDRLRTACRPTRARRPRLQALHERLARATRHGCTMPRRGARGSANASRCSTRRAILERGYAIATDEAGQIVRDAKVLRPVSASTVEFARGRVDTQVRPRSRHGRRRRRVSGA